MGIVFCCHEDYYEDEEKKVIAMEPTAAPSVEIVNRVTSPTRQEWDFCEEDSVKAKNTVEATKVSQEAI